MVVLKTVTFFSIISMSSTRIIMKTKYGQGYSISIKHYRMRCIIIMMLFKPILFRLLQVNCKLLILTLLYEWQEKLQLEKPDVEGWITKSVLHCVSYRWSRRTIGIQHCSILSYMDIHIKPFSSNGQSKSALQSIWKYMETNVSMNNTAFVTRLNRNTFQFQ